MFTKESGVVHSQIALFDQNGEKISFEEIGEKKRSMGAENLCKEGACDNEIVWLCHNGR